MSWSQEFPTKEGLYWFYGYRYGMVSCGRREEPEFMLLEVFKVKNGVMYKADGQFMYKQEVEWPNFKKTEFPDTTGTVIEIHDPEEKAAP